MDDEIIGVRFPAVSREVSLHSIEAGSGAETELVKYGYEHTRKIPHTQIIQKQPIHE
jgi:hypothetical protein